MPFGGPFPGIGKCYETGVPWYLEDMTQGVDGNYRGPDDAEGRIEQEISRDLQIAARRAQANRRRVEGHRGLQEPQEPVQRLTSEDIKPS